MNTTEPYSPMARAKANPAPVMIAGDKVGKVMVKKVRTPEAPNVAAAATAVAMLLMALVALTAVSVTSRRLVRGR